MRPISTSIICFVDDDKPGDGIGGFQRLGGTSRVQLSGLAGSYLSEDGRVVLPNRFDDLNNKLADGDGGMGGKGRGRGGGGGGGGDDDNNDPRKRNGQMRHSRAWWLYIHVALVVYAGTFGLILLAVVRWVRALANMITNNAVLLKDGSSLHIQASLEAARRGREQFENKFTKIRVGLAECNPVPCVIAVTAGMATVRHVMADLQVSA